MTSKKTYKKPLGQLKIEKFCSDNNNLIQNYIFYLYKDVNYKIKLMTNSDATLDRNTHCGANICVETAASNDYYYITTSRKDYYCQNFLTINNNLLPLIKKCAFNYKVLLFSYGKIYRFDKWIFEDIEENENGFVNIPLTEAEDVYTYSADDFRTPKHYVNIKWDKLGYVRYSHKFDMHKTKCCLIYDHVPKYDPKHYIKPIHLRKTFSSEKEMFEFLNKCEVFEKPVKMRVFYKYIKQGFVKTNINNVEEKIYLVTEKTLPILFNVIPENVAHCAQSILVVNLESTTNIDGAQQAVQQKNDNIEKKVAEPRNSYKKLDKELDVIADKMADISCKKYSEKDIINTLLAYGSNKNMVDAYILGLYDKGLYKEAEYANKMFEILNNNKIGD